MAKHIIHCLGAHADAQRVWLHSKRGKGNSKQVKHASIISKTTLWSHFPEKAMQYLHGLPYLGPKFEYDWLDNFCSIGVGRVCLRVNQVHQRARALNRARALFMMSLLLNPLANLTASR